MFIPDDPKLRKEETETVFHPDLMPSSGVSSFVQDIPEEKSFISKIAQPTKDSVSGLAQLYGGGEHGIANKLKADIQAGAKDIQEGNVLKGVVKSGLRTAGDVAGAIYAPIGALVGATGLGKLFDKIGQMSQNEGGFFDAITSLPAVQNFAMEHPNAGEDFERVLTLALSGMDKSKIDPKTVVERTKKQMSSLETRIRESAQTKKNATEVKKLEKIIDTVSPKLTPKQMQEALADGTVTTRTAPFTRKITADFTGDKKTVQIARDTKGTINPDATYAENLKNSRAKTQSISENTIKPFLEENTVSFNYADFIKKMQMVEPTSSFAKDPASFKTYSAVRERIIDAVGNNLRNTASKKGDFGNMTDFNDVWDARKMVDSVADAELKNFSFGTPEYTGVKAAVQDMRASFKDFILDGLQYPGQMGKVNLMQEFLTEYRRRGNSIPNDKAAIKILQKQFGIENTPADVARMAFFRDQMNTLTSFFEAIDNLSAKTAREIGTNRFDRFGKKHPTTTKILKTAGLIGLGGIGFRTLGDLMD